MRVCAFVGLLVACASPDGAVALNDIETMARGTEPACVDGHIGQTGGWQVPNQKTGGNDTYFTPDAVFSTVAEAESWVEGVYPRMPILEPYADPFNNQEVTLRAGWFYSYNAASPEAHAALDYGRNVFDGSDAAFEVTAMAGGEVISATWTDLLGNTVVVEHQAPDGTRYRSIYAHLRNGARNDCLASKPFRAGAPNPLDPRPQNFEAFMATQDCAGTLSQTIWGTDAQTLPVAVGDMVSSGEVIAWSGSTGWGGIGFALGTGGTVADPAAGNHLHLFFAVLDTDTSQWVLIDPYGVYHDVASNCYDVYEEPEYERTLAAYYPSFSGVPLELFRRHPHYYPRMGYGLQTLHPYTVGNDVRLIGAYDVDLSPNWRAVIYATQPEFDTLFADLIAQDLQLREISVTIDPPTGEPRFNGIWQERTAEAWGAWINMTDDDYGQRWEELVVNGGHRVADHVAYPVGGERRHAAVFVKDGVGPWYSVWGYDASTFDTFAADRRGEGLHAVGAWAEDFPGDTRYGATFLKVPGDWVLDRSLPGFQAYNNRFAEMFTQGYRLHRVQGYADGTRFAAVWRRASPGPCSGVDCLVGFESLTGWSSSQATLALNRTRPSEGQAALEVRGSGYVVVNSAPLGAAMPQSAQELRFDLFIPADQPNPWYVGAAQAYLTCPSVNVWNAYLGQHELTPLARGQFHTLSYTIPHDPAAQVAGGPADCHVAIALNVNATPVPFMLDALRLR